MVKIFEIKTDKIIEFYNIFDNLEKICNEVTLSIVKSTENSEGYIRIMCVDKMMLLLVNIKLFAHNFDVFNCNKKIYNINIGTKQFCKILQTFEKDDRIELCVDSDDLANLIIKKQFIVMENQGYHEMIYKLQRYDKTVLNINESQIFNKKTTGQFLIPSELLHSICNELQKLNCETININLKEPQSITGKNNKIEVSTICNMIPDEVAKTIEQTNGSYPFKLIFPFISMCDNKYVSLSITKDKILFAEINDETFGVINICVTPIVEINDETFDEIDDDF